MPARTALGGGGRARWRTIWSTFRVDLLLVCLLILALTALPLGPVVYLPLVSLIVMGIGIESGRRVSVAFAVIAILAEMVRVHPGFSWTGFLILLTPLIAGLSGGYAGHRLRESRSASERSARRAQLLSVAMMRLPELDSTRAIYLELPRLLAEILGFTHADVLVPSPDRTHLTVLASFGWTPPPDIRLPMRSITGRAFLQAEMQHVPNVADDPDFYEGPGLGRIHSELALPIFTGSEPVAVLNLERATAGLFGAEEIATLQALAQAVGSAIERVERLRSAHETAHVQDFLLDFSRQLADAGPPESLARRALTILLPRLGADAGRVWQPSGRDLRMLAAVAEDEAPSSGALLPQNVPSEPIFVSDSTQSPYTTAEQLAHGLQSYALVPMRTAEGHLHAILELLYYSQPASFAAAQRRTALRASERLSEALQQSWMTTRLANLLDALHGLGSVGDAARLPDLALATALHLIPGTDAASLLIVDGETLQLAAHLGYGDTGAPHWTLSSEAAARRWYGGDPAQFLHGAPHLISAEAFGASSGLLCSLCVPLVHDQRLVGVLSLDSMTQEDAFPLESVSLAETFGMQFSVLLTHLNHRRTLERVARTDALTGLGNRRSFDERLAEEWQAHVRYRHPLSLVIIDLLGFKSVNDCHGHQAGDDALVAIARAMEGVRRDGDTLFRWGGDEFAVILSHADLPGAQAAAERYFKAILSAQTLDAEGAHLAVSANLGVASAPQDADTLQALLKVADDRVFEAKRAKLPVAPPREAVI